MIHNTDPTGTTDDGPAFRVKQECARCDSQNEPRFLEGITLQILAVTWRAVQVVNGEA